MDFRNELELLLAKYSKSRGSATPDFILADYLIGCLNNFNHTAVLRDQWHGTSTARERGIAEDRWHPSDRESATTPSAGAR